MISSKALREYRKTWMFKPLRVISSLRRSHASRFDRDQRPHYTYTAMHSVCMMQNIFFPFRSNFSHTPSSRPLRTHDSCSLSRSCRAPLLRLQSLSIQTFSSVGKQSDLRYAALWTVSRYFQAMSFFKALQPQLEASPSVQFALS